MSRAENSDRATLSSEPGEKTEAPGDLTLKAAGALWLRRARLEELEISTLRQYEQHLRLHIEPFLGDHAIAGLRSPVLENFKDRLLQTRSRALSRKVLTSLKGILNEAVRLGYVEQNPASVVRVRKARRGGALQFAAPVTGSKIPSKGELRLLLRTSEEFFPL